MYYNQRKHTTTKHSPIEIMSNVNYEKLLDEVRENTKKNQRNIQKMRALSSQKGRKYLSAIGYRQQEILYLFIFKAHNQKQIFC